MKTWNTPEISELKIAETASFWGDVVGGIFDLIDGTQPNGSNNGTVGGLTKNEWLGAFGLDGNEETGNFS